MPSHNAWLAKHFSNPETDFARVVKDASKRPVLINTLMAATASEPARTRLGSAKALTLIAEEAPALVYPNFDFFAGLLDSPNSILRWNAARVLASLARVDTENRIEPLLDKYLSPIDGNQMIGAANVILGAAEIARAKPALADRIARAILRVRNARFEHEECNRVAIGHAIRALDRFYHLIGDQPAVLAFVQAERESSRAAVRAKAIAFCRKHAPEVLGPEPNRVRRSPLPRSGEAPRLDKSKAAR